MNPAEENGMIGKARGKWRASDEQGHLSQLSKEHMSSQRPNSKHVVYTDLCNILCVYIIAISLLFFYESPHYENKWASDSCLLLELLSSCWVALSKFDRMGFVLYYYVLFYRAWLLSLQSFVSFEWQKEMNPEGRGCRKELGGEGKL